MAILRSVDGRFHDLPDDLLSRFEVPAELVSQVMAALGDGAPELRTDPAMRDARAPWSPTAGTGIGGAIAGATTGAIPTEPVSDMIHTSGGDGEHRHGR